jgi:SAM-dependent methyltransferase
MGVNVPDTPIATASAGHPGRAGRAYKAITALSMTVGPGPSARAIADLAAVRPEDHVVDIGCGPGTAARRAARGGASATGVDPAPLMPQLARRISAARGVRGVTWLDGSAEALPLRDGAATVSRPIERCPIEVRGLARGPARRHRFDRLGRA